MGRGQKLLSEIPQSNTPNVSYNIVALQVIDGITQQIPCPYGIPAFELVNVRPCMNIQWWTKPCPAITARFVKCVKYNSVPIRSTRCEDTIEDASIPCRFMHHGDTTLIVCYWHMVLWTTSRRPAKPYKQSPPPAISRRRGWCGCHCNLEQCMCLNICVWIK